MQIFNIKFLLGSSKLIKHFLNIFPERHCIDLNRLVLKFYSKSLNGIFVVLHFLYGEYSNISNQSIFQMLYLSSQINKITSHIKLKFSKMASSKFERYDCKKKKKN